MTGLQSASPLDTRDLVSHVENFHYWYRGEAQFTDGSLADGGPAGFEAGDR